MSAIVENPEEYFRQFVPERDRLLLDLEAQALREEIPIVGPLVGELLSLLVRATGAGRILELGTATGYSAIYLARACQERSGRVLTLEKEAEMAAQAQANLTRAGLSPFAEVRVGEALAEMAAVTELFDFIFMDIEKVDYARALPLCARVLRRGGLLVADNVAFPEAAEFNTVISRDPGWQTVHLLAFLPLHSPETDGLCLALRR